MKRLLLALSLLAAISCQSIAQNAAPSDPKTDVAALKRHIRYLASPELQGRRAGEPGNVLAAKYIADQFKEDGLKPAGDSGTYFQKFNFIAAMNPGPNNTCDAEIDDVTLNFAPDVDFRTLPFSADTTMMGRVVFVGYGISSDSLKFDEYANVSVQGKIVIVLRYSPETAVKDGRFRAYESLYRKTFIAREKGAVGVIIVTGPADEDKPGLMKMTLDRDFRSAGIPVINLKSSLADSIMKLAGSRKDLRTIQKEITANMKPASFEIPHLTINVQTNVVKEYRPTANVVGFLEGNDPSLKDQTVILGAHFDHLGMGGEGSGSMKPDTIAIHPGADDNASGSAGLLELARYLSSQRKNLRRSVLLIAFTGEELGLLGSAYYVNHPSYPLSSTIAMINLDMVGRMHDNVLVVEGMGTSPGFEELATKENNRSALKLTLKPDGFGPSDHASFYAKDIPVMFFFTNLHDDYHRPSDTWDKINYTGEATVVDYAARIVRDLVNADAKPSFVRVQSTAAQPGGDSRGTRVFFGSIPDFAGDVVGVKISGTRAGSPAEKAGLVAGDVIVKFGGKDIKNLYDFMYVLGDFKPGDEVEVVFKRAGKEMTGKTKLVGRQQ